METYPAGSITFVISENHSHDEVVTDDMALRLAQSLSDYFSFELSKRNLGNTIAVTGIEIYRGCVTIIISIGVVAAAAGGGWALVEFFKNYKDVREGLDKLVEDMKNMKVWVRKKIFGKTSPSTETTVQENKAVKDKPVEPFEILFQQAIDQYNSMDPDHRKFWAAGQEMTIMNEKGEYCKYTLAVKREDIKLPKEKSPEKVKKSKGASK